MASSTTPQDRAVEVITSFIAREVNADSAVIGFVRLQAAELTQELADAGLLSSAPQQEDREEMSSLRSEPAAAGHASSSASTEQVRILIIAAYGQGREDEAGNAEFRTEQELWDALSSNEVECECLDAAGIEVSRG